MELLKLLFFVDYFFFYFYVIYGKYNFLFNLEIWEIIEGDLVNRVIKIVIE